MVQRRSMVARGYPTCSLLELGETLGYPVQKEAAHASDGPSRPALAAGREHLGQHLPEGGLRDFPVIVHAHTLELPGFTPAIGGHPRDAEILGGFRNVKRR